MLCSSIVLYRRCCCIGVCVCVDTVVVWVVFAALVVFAVFAVFGVLVVLCLLVLVLYWYWLCIDGGLCVGVGPVLVLCCIGIAFGIASVHTRTQSNKAQY